MPSETVT